MIDIIMKEYLDKHPKKDNTRLAYRIDVNDGSDPFGLRELSLEISMANDNFNFGKAVTTLPIIGIMREIVSEEEIAEYIINGGDVSSTVVITEWSITDDE